MKFILNVLLLFISVNTYAVDFDISAYKGKVVYLDFWASWCGPCKESFPWMNELEKKYPGVKVIAINLDKTQKEADDFLKKHPAQFTVLFDPSGAQAEKFKVKGMPYSIIFDKSGKPVESHIGFSTEKSQQYIQRIQKLLGENK